MQTISKITSGQQSKKQLSGQNIVLTNVQQRQKYINGVIGEYKKMCWATTINNVVANKNIGSLQAQINVQNRLALTKWGKKEAFTCTRCNARYTCFTFKVMQKVYWEYIYNLRVKSCK